MKSTATLPAERPVGSPARDEKQACWYCGKDAPAALFCAGCEAILPLPERSECFTVLGLPRQLVIDDEALQRRYYELHRRVHPDHYATGPRAAREASLANSAAVNHAYRTLRDPVERGLYWLQLHGESLGAENNRVPADLAALVFDVQEKLEELRAARGGPEFDGLMRQLSDEYAELVERRKSCLERLQGNFARWDAGTGDAAALTRDLKAILSTIAYVSTLLRDVGRELES